MEQHYQYLYDMLSQVQGYIFPNELDLQWGLLIVLYPYITGLVAGAFILASLERVFNVKVLKPTYQLALLTALAFLLVATMPLVTHLGHPWRAYEILSTPHSTSAMAIFGFVYLWYLMVVLLLEIWFDYRRDMVIWSKQEKGFKAKLYKILSLGVTDISPKTVRWDEKIGYFITVVGIPSAFLLHGYVGFIFGSVKANPWWSTVMMPVIFLFSAMVSGIALVLFIYMAVSYLRKQKIDMKALDTVAKYLFYILIIDFTLESLDQIHRIYEAEESFEILSLLVHGPLFLTFFIFQILLGTLVPLAALGTLQFYKPKEFTRRVIYLVSSLLVLFGIFFMRWNVVIGGQLFSKSFYGFTDYKIRIAGSEGLLWSMVWIILPFMILAFLLWLLPPWKKVQE
ncbi:MAG TPA: polysulfide reductase NrfD [Bacteroidales bacterium]|nr:polysulfide reductase NrfD [Bacteroidales bacterium]HPE58120.1 polysulfide reductase NrfD [Bacteroidales bacterium]HRX96662.1 polysulfide reductase NrfD [Bacteroidales bacterium]